MHDVKEKQFEYIFLNVLIERHIEVEKALKFEDINDFLKEIEEHNAAATFLDKEAKPKTNEDLIEKRGVPDTKARNKICDTQLTASYLIDHSTVKLGCCEGWTKLSKRAATVEFGHVRKLMSVIV